MLNHSCLFLSVCSLPCISSRFRSVHMCLAGAMLDSRSTYSTIIILSRYICTHLPDGQLFHLDQILFLYQRPWAYNVVHPRGDLSPIRGRTQSMWRCTS